MKDFIKWKEKWIYKFTNHQIEQLKEKNIQEIKWNHLAKLLLSHVDTYKLIIDNLLENE